MSTDSERQVQTQSLLAEGTVGLRWGDPVSSERERELEKWLVEWAGISESEKHGRSGPFADVVLTGADIFWLAARTLADQSTLATTHAAAAELLSAISLEVLRPLP